MLRKKSRVWGRGREEQSCLAPEVFFHLDRQTSSGVKPLTSCCPILSAALTHASYVAQYVCGALTGDAGSVLSFLGENPPAENICSSLLPSMRRKGCVSTGAAWDHAAQSGVGWAQSVVRHKLCKHTSRSVRMVSIYA